MHRLLGLTIVAALLAPALAAAQSVCLPRSVFAANQDGELPPLHLGYVNNVLTLCAYERATTDKLLGCWIVDPTTGALGTSAATAVPGHGRRIGLDSKNCFDGYCAPGTTPSDDRVIFATNTDGSHAAIMNQTFLYVFVTNTKAKVAEIKLTDDVTNAPWDLVYNGDTLFVIGADAGPFIGVWVFKDDGSRAGPVTIPPDQADGLNIYKGGYGILGHDTVAFADAGLQNTITVTGANAAKKITKRTVSYAPCTADQFSAWIEADDSGNQACNRVLAAKYAPYVNMSSAQLSSGDIITALSGPAQGKVAVLNPAGLTERRRLNLPKCP
jgi:hypothetical protein